MVGKDGYEDKVGGKIGEVLREKNMTQKMLAEMAGITEAAVSHYIKGDREPRSGTLKLIAGALGVSATFLLGMGTGGIVNAHRMQRFERLRDLIKESMDSLTDEQKRELVQLLTK